MAPSDREIYEGCRVANEETTMTEETWAPRVPPQTKTSIKSSARLLSQCAESLQSEGETRWGGKITAADTMLLTCKTL